MKQLLSILLLCSVLLSCKKEPLADDPTFLYLNDSVGRPFVNEPTIEITSPVTGSAVYETIINLESHDIRHNIDYVEIYVCSGIAESTYSLFRTFKLSKRWHLEDWSLDFPYTMTEERVFIKAKVYTRTGQFAWSNVVMLDRLLCRC